MRPSTATPSTLIALLATISTATALTPPAGAVGRPVATSPDAGDAGGGGDGGPLYAPIPLPIERSTAHLATLDLARALEHLGGGAPGGDAPGVLFAPRDLAEDPETMPVDVLDAGPYEIQVLRAGSLDTAGYAVERDEYAPPGLGLVTGDQVYGDVALLLHEIAVVDDDRVEVGSAALTRLGVEDLWLVEGWSCPGGNAFDGCSWSTFGLLRTGGFDLVDAVFDVQLSPEDVVDEAQELAVAVAATHVLALDLCGVHAMSTTSYLPVTSDDAGLLEWIEVSVACGG